MRFKPKSPWKEMNVLIARPQFLLYNDNGDFLNLKIQLYNGKKVKAIGMCRF